MLGRVCIAWRPPVAEDLAALSEYHSDLRNDQLNSLCSSICLLRQSLLSTGSKVSNYYFFFFHLKFNVFYRYGMEETVISFSCPSPFSACFILLLPPNTTVNSCNTIVLISIDYFKKEALNLLEEILDC